jgi:REP-associated tyrosine transposase
MGQSRGFRKSKGISTPTSGIVRQVGGTALCLNCTRDRVHLLIRMSTHHSIADIAHLIKTNSSRWVHERWPHHLFAWQTGYGAFTVSESGAAALRAYTSNQQEHHKVRSFQEESLVVSYRVTGHYRVFWCF